MPSSVTIVGTLPLEAGRVYTPAETSALTEPALSTALDRVPAALSANPQAGGGLWVGPLRALYGGANGVVTFTRTYEWPGEGVTGADNSSFAVAGLMDAVRDALPAFAGWQLSRRTPLPQDTASAPTGRRLVMFFTQESSVLQGSAPEAHNIQAGFEANTRYSNPERGRWVGTAPRIVRAGSLTGSNRTSVAWLYEWPDTPWVRANISQLVTEVQGAVQRGLATETARVNTIGIAQPAAWDRVTATDYNPVVNGPYEFWACAPGTPTANCAQVTRTTSQFPNVTSTEYQENPIGPDSVLTHPGGSQDLWNDIKGFFTSSKFGWTVAAVAGVAALVYIAPLAATWSASRRPAYRRNSRGNPYLGG